MNLDNTLQHSRRELETTKGKMAAAQAQVGTLRTEMQAAKRQAQADKKAAHTASVAATKREATLKSSALEMKSNFSSELSEQKAQARQGRSIEQSWLPSKLSVRVLKRSLKRLRTSHSLQSSVSRRRVSKISGFASTYPSSRRRQTLPPLRPLLVLLTHLTRHLRYRRGECCVPELLGLLSPTSL